MGKSILGLNLSFIPLPQHLPILIKRAVFIKVKIICRIKNS
jgi:hypothetical protein